MGEVLRHGTLSVGFIGLAETLVSLTGKHHGESEKSQKLGIGDHQPHAGAYGRGERQTGLNFTLLATPAEGLSGRFLRMDQKKYGKIPASRTATITPIRSMYRCIIRSARSGKSSWKRRIMR